MNMPETTERGPTPAERTGRGLQAHVRQVTA